MSNVSKAIGFIETVGMVPALNGADKMLKSADVELVGYENIGSTLVTVMVKGDIAAVQTAVESGVEAASKIGNLTASNTMPRAIEEVHEIVSIYSLDSLDKNIKEGRHEALGLIETFGIVYALEAADIMCKAANVDLKGFENVASGYISILVTGDVGACQQAVEAGVKAVEKMGTKVYSSVVIASPHESIEKIIDRYSMDKLK